MPTTYAIPNGNLFMNPALYTGNNGTTDTTYNFAPDMVWYKCRSNGSTDHYIFDTVRGANNAVYPNLTNAENTNFPTSNTQSFITNGSRIVYNGGDHLNASGRTYVNWAWKAGGTAVSNTAGSITSQVGVDKQLNAKVLERVPYGGSRRSVQRQQFVAQHGPHVYPSG